jgi:hypothetical protein
MFAFRSPFKMNTFDAACEHHEAKTEDQTDQDTNQLWRHESWYTSRLIVFAEML